MPRPRTTARVRLEDAPPDVPQLGDAPARCWRSKEGAHTIGRHEVLIDYYDGLAPGWYWELLPPKVEVPDSFGSGHSTLEAMVYITTGRPLATPDSLVIAGPFPTSAWAWQSARKALA